MTELPVCAPPRLFMLGYPGNIAPFECKSHAVPDLQPLSMTPEAYSKSYWYQPHLGECPLRLLDHVSDDNDAGPDSFSMFCSTPLAATFRPPESACTLWPDGRPISCTSCLR